MRRLIAPAALVALWLAASLARWPSPRALPTPGAFAATALAELRGPTIWRDLGATLARLGAGLAIAVLAGALLGLVLGGTARRWRAAAPTVDFVRAVPPILTFPLFLLALGYGESARVASVAFGTFGIIVLHVADGLARPHQARTDTVRLAGLTGARAFVHLYAWEALPSLLVSVRVALAAGLVIVVVTEMVIGADYGLGARALAGLTAYRPDLVWLVILLAGLVGWALSAAIAALQRRFVRW